MTRIAEQLGVSPAGLRALARRVAQENAGRIADQFNDTVGAALGRRGCAVLAAPGGRWHINNKGRALVERARAMGW